MNMLESEDRERGLLLTFTGDGKGKSSAAFGIALRALGWGWRIAVLQFMKGERPTGERNFFRQYFPETLFEAHGLGLTTRPGDHAACARQGWERARELLTGFSGELLILDELCVALFHGYLDCGEVIETLRNRRSGLNVVVTGRHAPPELRELSDLVSEIGMVKHPYTRGIPARKGIDY